MTLLPEIFAVVGTMAIIIAVLAIVLVDRRLWPAHLSCSRCRHAWIGRHKLCQRCGGVGDIVVSPDDSRALQRLLRRS
jgi:hypothetical protein